MKMITPLALTVSLAAALALTGCGATASEASSSSPFSSSPSNSSASASEPTKEAAKPADLTGTWKQANSASADSYQEAEIAGDVITINWVTDNGDTKSIYWIGTFTPPTDATTPYKWTSTRDQEATASAMLASQDDTKEFTFEDETLSYSASALGTTTTVKLKKG